MIIILPELLMSLNLELRPSTIPNSGQGLFTTCNIAKGTVLGEYAGRHFRPAKILSSYREAYVFCTANGVMVSPYDDCIFRYANVIRYSDRPCNIDWYISREDIDAAKALKKTLQGKRWSSPEFLHTESVWIVAKIDIAAGSELFIDYGDIPDRPGSPASGYWTSRVTSRKNRLELPPVSGEALADFLEFKVQNYWDKMDRREGDWGGKDDQVDEFFD